MGHTRLAIGNHNPSSRREKKDNKGEIQHPSYTDAIVLLHARAPGERKEFPCANCTCEHELDKRGFVLCPDLGQSWRPVPRKSSDCYLFVPIGGQGQLAFN